MEKSLGQLRRSVPVPDPTRTGTDLVILLEHEEPGSTSTTNVRSHVPSVARDENNEGK
jgi:hypothetical protein